MSFDKNYPNRKDKRKVYYRSKSFDRTCRNHGSCPWCKGNRTFFDKKWRLKSKSDELSNWSIGPNS